MQKIISNIAFILKEYHFFILAEFFHKIATSIDKKNFVPLFKYANFLIERKKYSQAEKIYFEISKNGNDDEKSESLFLLAILAFNKNIDKNIGELFAKSYQSKLRSDSNILEKFYPPFIMTLDINIDGEINLDELNNNFYDYEKKNSKNSFSKHGHVNTYQSNHDLNKNPDFEKIYSFLEKNINLNLKKYFFKEKNFSSIEIKKLWFVISRYGSKMHKHSHDGFLSGVFYTKISEDDNPGFIKFNNPQKNIKVLNINDNKHYISEDEVITFKPHTKQLIVFNSYLEHWVVDNISNISRISLPWDGDYKN